ncbi:uncharacterized protein LY79DRAFT_3406 [Colletotrichum navitas]|uniref:Uncharacterized protein n=1 Tax=Colletotrichum navitas TaxID=681940 RepID=A0AAD8VCE9_9PEZI|nr:uncharacterized protein LY79DRAFT_3406 [Colletotrichum navitas]KAK1599991.1 hypothetical protein LY79DRAFT_3406 [Colletotrichum navitas]
MPRQCPIGLSGRLGATSSATSCLPCNGIERLSVLFSPCILVDSLAGCRFLSLPTGPLRAYLVWSHKVHAPHTCICMQTENGGGMWDWAKWSDLDSVCSDLLCESCKLCNHVLHAHLLFIGFLRPLPSLFIPRHKLKVTKTGLPHGSSNEAYGCCLAPSTLLPLLAWAGTPLLSPRFSGPFEPPPPHRSKPTTTRLVFAAVIHPPNPYSYSTSRFKKEQTRREDKSKIWLKRSYMVPGRIRMLVLVCPPHHVQLVHGSAQSGPSHNTAFHMVSSSSQVPGERLRVCHLMSSRQVVWMVTSRRHPPIGRCLYEQVQCRATDWSLQGIARSRAEYRSSVVSSSLPQPCLLPSTTSSPSLFSRLFFNTLHRSVSSAHTQRCPDRPHLRTPTSTHLPGHSVALLKASF